MSIYERFTPLENDRYILTLTNPEDCGGLFKVYSDKNALPFFNSDNCDGDNFYYATEQRMREALDFWAYAYDKHWFA